MVCNIRNKISRDTVFTHQHPVLFIAEIGGPEPQCTVLFVGMAACLELFDYVPDRAVVMQRALPEPGIISNAVFFKVFVQSLNIYRQSEINKRLAPFLLGHFSCTISVFIIKILCMGDYIHSQINVLGHRELLGASVFSVYLLAEILNGKPLCRNRLSSIA